MLGRLKLERRWHWFAHGKHPSTKDYFRIGTEFPLAKAFSEWIGNGYEGIVTKNRPVSSPTSWRFWTRERRQDHLVCGIVRDSSDAFGRPYPLLIMGSGPMAGWDENWDLAPFACENSWGQMEYLSARPFADLRTFEAEVLSFKAPVPDWPEFARRRDDCEALSSPVPDGLRIRMHCLSEASPFLALDGQRDQFEIIGLCHRVLRVEGESPPNVVFMGGSISRTYFAPFRRALQTSDFVRLWRLPEEDGRMKNEQRE